MSRAPDDDALLTPEVRHLYQRYRVQTFILTWTAYASLYLCRKNLSVVKDRLGETFHLTAAQLGDIDTGYLVAYAVGQFVNGTIGDKIGGKRLVGIGLIATACLNIFFSQGQLFAFFLLGWTLNGVAQSTGWPGCAKTFSAWYSQHERGTVMGLWCTCYQVGAVVSTFLATWLLVTFSWKMAFIGPAMLVGGFGLVFLTFQRRSPEAEGLPDVEVYYAEIKGRHPTARERAFHEEVPSFRESIGHVLRSRPIWTLGLTYVVLKFTRYTFLFWLPFYMSRQLGYGEGEAGYTSVVFDLAGIGGAVFAGFVSDRVFKSRRAPIVVIMMLLLAGATFGYSQVSELGRAWNIFGIALIGFLVYGPDSVTSGVAAVDFGQKRAASLAAGFVNGMGSIGGALSGVVVGRFSEAYGWKAVFTLFSPLAIVGALLMLTLWNKAPKTAASIDDDENAGEEVEWESQAEDGDGQRGGDSQRAEPGEAGEEGDRGSDGRGD